MKLAITREWFERRAKLEGDLEISAGRLARDPTPDQTDTEVADADALDPMRMAFGSLVETMRRQKGLTILPWHEDLMLGDQEQTLTPGLHVDIEAEANYAAGQLLFLQSQFRAAANDSAPGLAAVRTLKGTFGNTYTTTFWRYIQLASKNSQALLEF